MKVSVQFAVSHFDDIAAAVERGEDVEILRPGKTGLQLIERKSSTAKLAAGRRVLGAGAGELRVFSADERSKLDHDVERQMCEDPLMTTGEI